MRVRRPERQCARHRRRPPRDRAGSEDAYATYNLATALLMRKESEGRKLLERACRLAPELRARAERDPDITSALAALDE
jgi:hypothetical protein